MALSGTRTWIVTSGQLITDALVDLTVLAAGETANANDVADARRNLNGIAKLWSGKPNFRRRGFQVWNRESTSLNIGAKIKHELKPSAGDANISIPTHIISATLKDTDNQEIVLTPMSEQDYYAIGDKTSTSEGTPSRYYYERKLAVGNFYFDIYPSTDVQGWTCEIVYQQEADDMDVAADDYDFPKEWYLPLKYALMMTLAPGHLGDIPKWLSALYQEYVEEAVSFHPEEESDDMYFQPGRD